MSVCVGVEFVLTERFTPKKTEFNLKLEQFEFILV